MQLFESYQLGSLKLKNRVVMAPMTRSRATADHIPTPIMATYYEQRSGAGLIITEGTAPAANGVGYPRIPGLYNDAQVEAWKEVTAAVHEKGSVIFAQLMHTGRVSHPENMPEGTTVMGPSPVALTETQMYVDGKGNQPIPTPAAMTAEDIQNAIQGYVQAAKNAIEAGFDGVEIHGANGYLIDQFISPNSNQRTDRYGGSVENRTRFALEVTAAVIEAIGKERVGIRLSPYGVFNEIGLYDELDETFTFLASELNKLAPVYVHLVDHQAMGAPEVPASIKQAIRQRFEGTLILSGGYDGTERAEQDLQANNGDLVAYGRPFISNPDLVLRLQHGEALAQPNYDLFYTPGAEGYIDYPVLEHQEG